MKFLIGILFFSPGLFFSREDHNYNYRPDEKFILRIDLSCFLPADIVSLDYLPSVMMSGTNIPPGYYMSDNYPNPFNPSTKIDFGIPPRLCSSVRLYDTGGKMVKEITPEEFFPGTYTLYLDLIGYSKGIYFVRFKSGKTGSIKKITFIK